MPTKGLQSVCSESKIFFYKDYDLKTIYQVKDSYKVIICLENDV